MFATLNLFSLIEAVGLVDTGVHFGCLRFIQVVDMHVGAWEVFTSTIDVVAEE